MMKHYYLQLSADEFQYRLFCMFFVNDYYMLMPELGYS